jgi:hypothetical protein
MLRETMCFGKSVSGKTTRRFGYSAFSFSFRNPALLILILYGMVYLMPE